jgi:hypothetical protein
MIAAVTSAAPAAPASALDVTAEAAPDAATLVAEHEQDAVRQARLDRLKTDFDFDQQERAELLREMNVLREMAIEQQKKDDEMLKKWIALI